MRPRLDNSLPNGSHGSNEAGDEYGSAASEDAIEWFGQPAAQNCARKIWTGDDEAGDVVNLLLAA